MEPRETIYIVSIKPRVARSAAKLRERKKIAISSPYLDAEPAKIKKTTPLEDELQIKIICANGDEMAIFFARAASLRNARHEA